MYNHLKNVSLYLYNPQEKNWCNKLLLENLHEEFEYINAEMIISAKESSVIQNETNNRNAFFETKITALNKKMKLNSF